MPKGSLRLEVTESLVMENPEQAAEILEWLRSAGADLALDDFGTGYSSLAYLHRLPFDTIKIDRSLCARAAARDGSGAAIVRSMVALAHELGKKVVAEGVETPDDVAFLRGIGCEYAQGFYYGEPIPERDVIQLLRMVQNPSASCSRAASSAPSARSGAGIRNAAAAAGEVRRPGANSAARRQQWPLVTALQSVPVACSSARSAARRVRPRQRPMPRPASTAPQPV